MATVYRRNPALFAIAKSAAKAYSERQSRAAGRGDEPQAFDRIIMEETTQKSCWGVTIKAVAGFAGLLILAWLFGGSETAAVLATS